jgi:redox-sensitive bicupin YhaK (pirin superfamily)
VQDVVTRPEYIDVHLPAGATFTHRTARGHTVFAYVIGGKGVFCQQLDPYAYDAVGENYFDMKREPQIGDGHLIHFGDGDEVTVSADGNDVRFLLISGKPIREPIAWYGPIVMNTQAQLRTAYEELERGSFIKEGGTGH